MNRRLDPVLLLLLAVSLVANVLLYRRANTVESARLGLRAGDKVPDFTGQSLDGSPFLEQYQTRPVILYTFSPACIWCERNLDNVRALSASVADDYDFVAVALDKRGLDAYVSSRRLTWKIVGDVPSEVLQAYQFGVTPQTVVVGIGGTVRHVWTGAFVATVAEEIEATFRVALPGLSDATTDSGP